VGVRFPQIAMHGRVPDRFGKRWSLIMALMWVRLPPLLLLKWAVRYCPVFVARSNNEKNVR
jgi:hypothetical protein